MSVPSPAAAASQALPPLLVGSVREPDGSAVSDGTVRAIDAAGRILAGTTTDRSGTFALALPAGAHARVLRVSCRYCRTVSTALGAAGEPSVVIIDRDNALASSVPTPADVRALPYVRASDVLGLIPFTLATAGGGVSDRGLAGGRSLLIDNGAPVGSAPGAYGSAVADVPSRDAAHIAAVDPLRAASYGGVAAGGGFALESGGEASRAFADAGLMSDAGVALRLGPASFAGANAHDTGTHAQRADVRVDLPGLGGVFVASSGFGAATTAPSGLSDASLGRTVALDRLAYATVSQRASTAAAVSFADVGATYAGLASYRSQYASGSLRVEYPAAVTIGMTANGTLENGNDAYAAGSEAYALAGRLAQATMAFDASAHGAAGSIFAGLALADAGGAGSANGIRFAKHLAAVLPTLDATLNLEPALALHLGLGDALDTPNAAALGRTSLAEATMRFDDGMRIRAEVGAYRSGDTIARAFAVAGFTSAVAWEIVPHLDLRISALLGTTSREIAWATYAGRGLRVDAIVRDEPPAVDPIARALAFGEPNATGRRALLLDADLLVPLGQKLTLEIGTVQRSCGRTLNAGVRFP